MVVTERCRCSSGAVVCDALAETPARARSRCVGRFPGETSALSLIWAVLELSSRGSRRITMTPSAVAQIERMRRGQTPLPADDPTQEVIAA